MRGYKYHVIFVVKRQRNSLYGELRKHPGEVFRELAVQKESETAEGYLLLGMCIR